MRAVINTELVRNLPARDVDIRDTKLRGFVLRCRASGSHSYRVNLGRGRWLTLGSAEELKPVEAREEARNKQSLGEDPLAAKRAAKASLTLRQFVDRHYEPWALEHLKRGKETVQRVRTAFSSLMDLPLENIESWAVEKWRTERLRQTPRPKPATVNDYVTLLRVVLSKAVAWKKETGLQAHPMGKVKMLQADKTGRIRYLSPGEETRLRNALAVRDEQRRIRRARANEWRRERGYPEWPVDNPDHLAPIVRLALNTGLRKGEIFNLKWSDVDLSGAQITVRGEGAKSGQTRYLPLNTEAVGVLTTWRQGRANDDYVFTGREQGEPLDDIKKAWTPLLKAARIQGFRFHDLRHTFASKLVMAGVDLNTVRELLGHSDIKMTLRYSHLAPEHKAAAVAKLLR
jgi:integrase